MHFKVLNVLQPTLMKGDVMVYQLQTISDMLTAGSHHHMLETLLTLCSSALIIHTLVFLVSTLCVCVRVCACVCAHHRLQSRCV